MQAVWARAVLLCASGVDKVIRSASLLVVGGARAGAGLVPVVVAAFSSKLAHGPGSV